MSGKDKNLYLNCLYFSSKPLYMVTTVCIGRTVGVYIVEPPIKMAVLLIIAARRRLCQWISELSCLIFLAFRGISRLAIPRIPPAPLSDLITVIPINLSKMHWLEYDVAEIISPILIVLVF